MKETPNQTLERIASETLVPEGSLAHVSIYDPYEDYDCDEDDEADRLYNSEPELEITVAVSGDDYEYAEQRLDAFRERLKQCENWEDETFGVTLLTFDEMEHIA